VLAAALHPYSEVRPKEVMVLVGGLLGHQDARVRASAAQLAAAGVADGLPQRVDVMGALIGLLGDGSREVCARAAEGLLWIAEAKPARRPAVLKALLRHRDSPAAEVRCCALRAMASEDFARGMSGVLDELSAPAPDVCFVECCRDLLRMRQAGREDARRAAVSLRRLQADGWAQSDPGQHLLSSMRAIALNAALTQTTSRRLL
jgi:hypothetical protein